MSPAVQPSRPLRWGIVGTGRIAGDFAKDLRFLDDQVVAAVGSRTLASAQKFADTHGAPRAYGSYEALVADPDVDVVYVATPHPYHCPNALLALEAGKPVLVEKPFAMGAPEARTMADAARHHGLFLMEAMWMRFVPSMRRIREVVAQGTIGSLVSLQADHGWWIEPRPGDRHFVPELGGGALLDLGIYPVSLAAMLFGPPQSVASLNTDTATGVDAQTSILLGYASGAHAVRHSTLLATVSNTATITGTQGRIEIDSIFYTPTSFTVFDRHGTVLERHERNYEGHGLREEAIEVARCLRAGLTESPLLPLDESIGILETVDTVRAQARSHR